jgi:hypothetical protein
MVTVESLPAARAALQLLACVVSSRSVLVDHWDCLSFCAS